MKTKKTSAIITTIVFITVLFGLTIMNLMSPDRVFSDKENRYLEKKPKFSFEKLVDGEFTEKYEKYVTDQFVSRDKWTQVKTLCELAMQKKDNNGVYFGKDGYLLGKHDDTDIDKVQEKKNINYLAGFIDRYAQKLGNDRVSCMIVPTSGAILKDKLPPYATGYDQNSLIDSVKSSLKGGTFVDVRDTLSKHRDEYIYYKTDHHWTSLGAYYSYLEWCKDTGIKPIKEDEFTWKPITEEFYGTHYSKANFYNIAPDEINIMEPKEKKSYKVVYNNGEKTADTLYNDSFLSKRDKYSVFLSGNNPIVDITTENKNGRNLLIVKDSFGHSFAPIAANNFENIHMIDFRYFSMSIDEYIKEKNITDILVMYNTINFVTDRNLFKFTSE